MRDNITLFVKKYAHEIMIVTAVLVNVIISVSGMLNTTIGIWANSAALASLLWTFSGIRMKSVANHHAGSAVIVLLITAAFATYVIPAAPGFFHTSVIGLALGLAFLGQLIVNLIGTDSFTIRFMFGGIAYAGGLGLSLIIFKIAPEATTGNPSSVLIAYAALFFIGLSLMPEKDTKKKERCQMHLKQLKMAKMARK